MIRKTDAIVEKEKKKGLEPRLSPFFMQLQINTHKVGENHGRRSRKHADVC